MGESPRRSEHLDSERSRSARSVQSASIRVPSLSRQVVPAAPPRSIPRAATTNLPQRRRILPRLALNPGGNQLPRSHRPSFTRTSAAMRVNNILETIGNTPHVRLNRLYSQFPGVEVWLKLERANPGASIKDRIGIAMIDDAERRGTLKKGGTIVEPTSGNTGIGLAMAAAVKGYRCILVMPETMSMERRRVMAAYGAELVLTAKELGTKGAINKANEVAAGIEGSWIPNQFDNPANVDIHRRTTAQEILKDFPDGIDFLITGVGTGGHITGVAEVLKKTMPKLKAFAVEPVKSQPIAGGTHSPHKIQGIGTGFIPGNL